MSSKASKTRKKQREEINKLHEELKELNERAEEARRRSIYAKGRADAAEELRKHLFERKNN